MPFSARLIRGIQELDPKTRSVLLDLLEELEKDRRDRVTRVDFEELRSVVADLLLAVKELAQAQKRTDERLEELAQAQKKTEEKVQELAVAQKNTEDVLTKLIKRVDKIGERLEGISNSVGYSLENASYKALPNLLKEEGITVKGKIIRRYYGENQINIWAEAMRGQTPILIVGEVKVRPSKVEVDRFLKIVNTIKDKEGKETYPLFVAHDYHPKTEQYLREKGIKYYWSYEMD